jgi:carbonic anhydrase/acetyltransferase-like protein (isoleucine patch superfamily)
LAIYELDGIGPELPDEGEYWIAPNAVVIGRVRLLKGASVWFGAVIRGDNDWITLGENTNIQDNSVLHTDAGIPLTLGSNVTVGHSVTLHGCTIGDNSLIGIGSTVLNRAVIGQSSIVGAHALVPENKEFPEKSLLLGAPARVARTLSDEQAASLRLVAEHYVENMKRYRGGFKQIG